MTVPTRYSLKHHHESTRCQFLLDILSLNCSVIYPLKRKLWWSLTVDDTDFSSFVEFGRWDTIFGISLLISGRHLKYLKLPTRKVEERCSPRCAGVEKYSQSLDRLVIQSVWKCNLSILRSVKHKAWSSFGKSPTSNLTLTIWSIWKVVPALVSSMELEKNWSE